MARRGLTLLRLCSLIFVCILALFCASLLGNVEKAQARSGDYSIDELSTAISVETNGSIHVIEHQVVTFEDVNRGMVWYLHKPEGGESVRIANMRSVPVDNGGTPEGDWVRLQMLDSNASQQGRNPGDTAAPFLRVTGVQPWYSYNIGDGMVRCYFPTGRNAVTGEAEADAAEFHTYLIETDYTVSHRVQLYRDAGELYWRYANDSLPADARNVSLVVTLPVGADAGDATLGEDVIAWGHGHDEGSFSVGADGTVTYTMPIVAQGNYADAHILFPSSWIGNVHANASNLHSSLRRSDAISEESQWVDSAARGAAWDNKVRIIFLVLSTVVILVGTVAVLRYGRSPRSRRALVRVASILGIVALAEQLFFRESLTTFMLAAEAIIVLAVALFLPLAEDAAEDEAADAEEVPSHD